MRPPDEVDRVRELARGGLNHCQIARATGIPRSTIRGWLAGAKPRLTRPQCPLCGHLPHDFSQLPTAASFRTIGTPQIIGEIVRAVRTVMPANRVRVDAKHRGWNCVQISSSSKAWPCYFPQAGPGRKHERKIELTAWQWAYVWQEPGMFLRGLIHSDGCRVTNKVWGGKYEYPRYFFTNHSLDIQQLFKDACDLIGVEYKNNNWYDISVARRQSVALLDEIVGPKT